MTKEERTNRYKLLSSIERQELILKKMKEKGIEVGSGIPKKILWQRCLRINSYCKLFSRIKREKIKKIFRFNA